MAWSDGLDRAVNYIITAANWNALLGAAGSLMQLKNHAHGGTTGEGSQSLGPLVLEDFTDAAAPAAPGAGKTRLYAVSGRPRFRAGAAGADTVIPGAHSELTSIGVNDHHNRDHAATHQPGGADAMAVDAAAATGSLRTLGTGATQALPGNTSFGAPIVVATEQATTSGTTKDFTGIPSGTKRIVIMGLGVSGNGTTWRPAIQIGDAGGIETTGYVGRLYSNGTVTAFSTSYDLGLKTSTDAVDFMFELCLEDSSDNTWVLNGWTYTGVASNGDGHLLGYKPLSAELDRVRLLSVNGETFDAGAVSISYE